MTAWKIKEMAFEDERVAQTTVVLYTPGPALVAPPTAGMNFRHLN